MANFAGISSPQTLQLVLPFFTVPARPRSQSRRLWQRYKLTVLHVQYANRLVGALRTLRCHFPWGDWMRMMKDNEFMPLELARAIFRNDVHVFAAWQAGTTTADQSSFVV